MTHRYLGVALGLLMLVWFLSGIVMMYVPYPQRGESERTSGLAPIAWARCCDFGAITAGPDAEVQRAQLETVAGVPVLRLRVAPGRDYIADLAHGTPLALDDVAARRIASETGARVISPAARIVRAEAIDVDQWTVGENGNNRRPLYRYQFDDAGDTRLYVSSVTGEVVVWTTRSQRFWNWLGAIPHWLYFTQLRKNVPLWSDIIIYTSLLGTFLTVIGLYLGIMRFRRSKSGRLSPYSGWFYWHHLIGLAFGIVVLTWVVSGMFSMNPWGFLESSSGDPRPLVAGAPQSWSAVRQSLERIQARAREVVSITSAPYAGRLFWLARDGRGAAARYDADGVPAPVQPQELADAAQRLAKGAPIESAGLMRSEDAYYFAFQGFTDRDPLPLPVYRVVLSDAEHTRYYLHPQTGALLQRVDSAGRGYRWLFNGLHRWDFTGWLRARPVWDIVVLFLMLGGTIGTFTGVYLGLRRIGIDLGLTRRRN